MTNLISLVKQQRQLEQTLADEIAAHKVTVKTLEDSIKSIQETRNIIGTGLDEKMVACAEAVIRVEGDAGKIVNGSYPDQTRSGIRWKAIEDAITDLANGGSKLKGNYFGVKNYDRFGDQREDHNYGMGPRHGSIVFRIGLVDRKKELTEQEIEAAIYYLTHLKTIQDAKQAA